MTSTGLKWIASEVRSEGSKKRTPSVWMAFLFLRVTARRALPTVAAMPFAASAKRPQTAPLPRRLPRFIRHRRRFGAVPSSASAKLYFSYRKSTQNPGIIAIPGFFLLIWFNAI